MNLYDIHTHDIPEPNAEDEEQSLNNQFILNVYPLGFEYAKDNNDCHLYSCGVHPWHSENAEPQIIFLKEIASDPRIVAIGEAGYDKLKGPDLSVQRSIFEKQIELSESLNKPLIIHCVKAWNELLDSWKRHKPKQAWIIHGYRGKPELTRQLINHGFYFSINDKFNIESLKYIPLDRLFCETDTSDIPISEIYWQVADTLQISKEELANRIEENIEHVFSSTLRIKNISEELKKETNEQ